MTLRWQHRCPSLHGSNGPDRRMVGTPSWQHGVGVQDVMSSPRQCWGWIDARSPATLGIPRHYCPYVVPSQGVYTGSDVGRGLKGLDRAESNQRRISARAFSTPGIRRRATPPTFRTRHTCPNCPRLPCVETLLLSAQVTLPCVSFRVAHFQEGRLPSCMTVGCGVHSHSLLASPAHVTTPSFFSWLRTAFGDVG